MRRKEREEPSEEEFDVAPKWEAPQSPPATLPPSDMLTSDKVAAVRFHPSRPGYAFNQVETFVGQVKDTLTYLEAVAHQRELELHEAREEVQDLTDKTQNLQRTIEVFRAQGDPVRNEDGSYVTASQMPNAAQEERLMALNDMVRDLHAQLAEKDAALAAVESGAPVSGDFAMEKAALEASLATLAAERDHALAEAEKFQNAEQELRRYVDETLMPWIQSQQEAADEPQEIPQPEPVPVPTATVEPVPVPEVEVEVLDRVVVAPDPVPEPGNAAEDTLSVVQAEIAGALNGLVTPVVQSAVGEALDMEVRRGVEAAVSARVAQAVPDTAYEAVLEAIAEVATEAIPRTVVEALAEPFLISVVEDLAETLNLGLLADVDQHLPAVIADAAAAGTPVDSGSLVEDLAVVSQERAAEAAEAKVADPAVSGPVVNAVMSALNETIAEIIDFANSVLAEETTVAGGAQESRGAPKADSPSLGGGDWDDAPTIHDEEPLPVLAEESVVAEDPVMAPPPAEAPEPASGRKKGRNRRKILSDSPEVAMLAENMEGLLLDDTEEEEPAKKHVPNLLATAPEVLGNDS